MPSVEKKESTASQAIARIKTNIQSTLALQQHLLRAVFETEVVIFNKGL